MKKFTSNTADYYVRWRRRYHLTQAEVAELLNYTDSTISDFERGIREPSLVQFIRSCNIFGEDPGTVLSNGRPSVPLSLDSDEVQLVQLYRKCSGQIRSAVMSVLSASAGSSDTNEES